MNRIYPRLILAAAAVAALSSLPALAATRIEKNLKLESGGKLTVLADAGSVAVTGSSSSGAHVLLTSDKDDFDSKFDLKFEELPGELRITLKKKESLSSWTSWFNNSKIKFEIQVPTRTATNLQTGGGHIEASDIQGNLSAETSGGHIAVKNISGTANLETSGGHIEAAGVNGNLVAETSGGHIEITDAKGRVDADTSGGHVEVAFAKGNAFGGKIESSGGSITVSVDPNVDLSIDASTSGGSVRTDIPVKIIGKVKGSSIKGTIGKGGEALYVHTSGGSVTLNSVDDTN